MLHQRAAVYERGKLVASVCHAAALVDVKLTNSGPRRLLITGRQLQSARATAEQVVAPLTESLKE